MKILDNVFIISKPDAVDAQLVSLLHPQSTRKCKKCQNANLQKLEVGHIERRDDPFVETDSVEGWSLLGDMICLIDLDVFRNL